MSSGGKTSRNNKGPKGGAIRSSVITSALQSQAVKSDHNHNDNDSKSAHKIAPTSDQLHIAHMIDNTQTELVLQEKMLQVTQVTGVSTDDASIALHDWNNDVNAAIDALLEGDGQGEWKESNKKKKKTTAKGKESKDESEAESNKENQKLENRERSGSRPRGGPPRSRGRGGRGSREDAGESSGRGVGRKNPRMINGSAGSYRGRGTRGRGSGSYRTFQNRQPVGFTDTIDTWGSAPEKIDSSNNLQIDTWDEEPAASTEDWDNEWTGSLDKTTVFGASTTLMPSTSPNPVDVSESTHTVPGLENNVPGSPATSNIIDSSPSSLAESTTVRETNPVISLADSMNVLGMNQRLPSVPGSTTKPYGSSPGSATTSISQSEAMDLAALLQKAAPHSTLGRIPSSTSVDSGSLNSSSLCPNSQNNILCNITGGVDEAIKSAYVSAGVTGGPNVFASPTVSSSSIFSNSGLDSSVSNNLVASLADNNVSKVLNLSSQPPNLASRSKQTTRRISHSSSKIPSSAVEMPGDTMASLDMQFAGLEFGTEAFDFTADVKAIPSNVVSGNKISSRDTSTSSSVGKDLGSVNSLSQQQSFGPEPIPFPAQSSERKTASGSLLSTQRAPPPSPATSSFVDLKKDNSSPLGALVGSTPSPSSPYQPSGSYSSKTTSSFPSPPSAHFAQSASQNYSSSNSSGVDGSSYVGSTNNSNKSASNNSSSSSNPSSGAYSSTFQGSSGSAQYQNSYVTSSSHSSLASINVPQTLSGLKESTQPLQNYNETSSVSSSSLSGPLSTNVSSGVTNSGPNALPPSLSSAPSSVQPVKSLVPGKSVNSLGSSMPPGVQHLPTQSQQVMQHQLSQPHQTHHQLQQIAQQQSQQTQQLMAGPSQYVTPQTAALQGGLPPAFYNVQQPAMYSYEDLQMFQRGIPHMQQAPTSLPAARDGSITTPTAYSVADAAKFRTDQNSSPVPSTINQQGAAPGGTYITATGNAAIPPFYMYHNMAVPSSFPQYGHPAIIQIPPNSHTGSTSTQFPGPPKLPYGGSSNYYDSISQSQDYKTGYGSGSQGQSKSGGSSTGSGSNPGTELSGYKNHLSKVGRSYEKQGFHSATPPPYNLPGSAGSNPMTANAYAPAMFFSAVPAGAQHHSPLMHHQLHQDGGTASSQRTGVANSQNKGTTKGGGYSGSYWGSN